MAVRYVKRVWGPLLLVLMLAIVGTTAVAWSHGYRLYAVQTGSMSPAYPTGALVVDEPPAADGGAQGAVITFKVGDGLVTHRIVESSPDGLVTKGDANETDDPWTVPRQNVVGRVVAVVPDLGYVLVFFKQPSGALAIVTGLWAVTVLWKLFFPKSIDDESALPGLPEPA